MLPCPLSTQAHDPSADATLQVLPFSAFSGSGCTSPPTRFAAKQALNANITLCCACVLLPLASPANKQRGPGVERFFEAQPGIVGHRVFARHSWATTAQDMSQAQASQAAAARRQRKARKTECIVHDPAINAQDLNKVHAQETGPSASLVLDMCQQLWTACLVSPLRHARGDCQDGQQTKHD